MKKPNVIMIVMDCARAANFSCYGYQKETTPNLDRFCRLGNLFRNAFTPAIWTIPSHASIFTGTYPSKHGALNLNRFLDDRYTTMSELLSRNGYETVAFSNNGFVSLKDFGLSRGFSLIDGFNYPRNKIHKAIVKAVKVIKRIDDIGAFATNRFARKWISNRSNPDKPFFLFLNYMEMHAPYLHVSRKYLNMHVGSAERKIIKNINQDRQKYLTRTLQMTEDEFEVLRSVYNAQLSYLDAMISSLLTFLKSKGLWDNTLIIVTADHGDLIGEHNLMHHSYAVYDELIKIPLIVKLPGIHDNGMVYDYLVSSIDILPTMIDLLGIEDERATAQIQGSNIFVNADPMERSYVFAECERPKNEFAETFPDFDFSVYDRQLLAIRSKKYKYIWASDGRHELFDLENDPSERWNIVDTMPVLAAEMKTRLFEWYDSYEKSPNGDMNREPMVNSKIKKHLQALGYF
jgi:arylsulfatase A-like enzyme